MMNLIVKRVFREKLPVGSKTIDATTIEFRKSLDKFAPEAIMALAFDKATEYLYSRLKPGSKIAYDGRVIKVSL